MRESLLKILRTPKSGEPLELYTFKSQASSPDREEDIIEGILLAKHSKKAYPIIGGVPCMLESSFTSDFLDKNTQKISQNETLSRIDLHAQKQLDWSFSNEWEYHSNSNLSITWGWTVEERVHQFFLETDTNPEECNGKLIFDAGCGNGQLSESLSNLGTTVVALDYSSSVFVAESRRKSPNVHFVRGDLQAPPFDADTFDIIISNGVIHHTPDTYKTFIEVAKLAKPNGRFYIWLYRRSEKFFRRYLFYPAVDLIRMIASRLPHNLQVFIVKSYAIALMSWHKILGKYKDRHRSWPERVVLAYDSLTPLWKHYHTPIEVSCWFFMNGYSPPIISHWDNSVGFGVVATKKPQKDTPGVNFGKMVVARRYWK